MVPRLGQGGLQGLAGACEAGPVESGEGGVAVADPVAGGGVGSQANSPPPPQEEECEDEDSLPSSVSEVEDVDSTDSAEVELSEHEEDDSAEQLVWFVQKHARKQHWARFMDEALGRYTPWCRGEPFRQPHSEEGNGLSWAFGQCERCMAAMPRQYLTALSAASAERLG